VICYLMCLYYYFSVIYQYIIDLVIIKNLDPKIVFIIYAPKKGTYYNIIRQTASFAFVGLTSIAWVRKMLLTQVKNEITLLMYLSKNDFHVVQFTLLRSDRSNNYSVCHLKRKPYKHSKRSVIYSTENN
jgi:hypothetical protein